jgi:hypothetical protein
VAVAPPLPVDVVPPLPVGLDPPVPVCVPSPEDEHAAASRPERMLIRANPEIVMCVPNSSLSGGGHL